MYNEGVSSTAPFKGVLPKKTKTKNRNISINEMAIILKAAEENLTRAQLTNGGQINFVDFSCVNL